MRVLGSFEHDGKQFDILAIHAIPVHHNFSGPTGTQYSSNQVESWATVRDVQNHKVSTVKLDGQTVTHAGSPWRGTITGD